MSYQQRSFKFLVIGLMALLGVSAYAFGNRGSDANRDAGTSMGYGSDMGYGSESGTGTGTSGSDMGY